MKEGRVKSAQENASPSSGAQTIGLLQEWISDRAICRNAELFPKTPAEPLRLRSRIASVIGETVMEPIARDVATVTVARGARTNEDCLPTRIEEEDVARAGGTPDEATLRLTHAHCHRRYAGTRRSPALLPASEPEGLA